MLPSYSQFQRINESEKAAQLSVSFFKDNYDIVSSIGDSIKESLSDTNKNDIFKGAQKSLSYIQKYADNGEIKLDPMIDSLKKKVVSGIGDSLSTIGDAFMKIFDSYDPEYGFRLNENMLMSALESIRDKVLDLLPDDMKRVLKLIGDMFNQILVKLIKWFKKSESVTEGVEGIFDEAENVIVLVLGTIIIVVIFCLCWEVLLAGAILIPLVMGLSYGTAKILTMKLIRPLLKTFMDVDITPYSETEEGKEEFKKKQQKRKQEMVNKIMSSEVELRIVLKGDKIRILSPDASKKLREEYAKKVKSVSEV